MKDVSWPGRVLLFLFRRFANPLLRDHIEGDLLEQYFHLRRSGKKRHAETRLLVDTLSLLRPAIIRRISIKNTISNNVYAMIQNNFKIAFRNLMRNTVSSIINIGGLTVGIAVALLIALWVYDETTFNKYHENYTRIGKVLLKGTDTKEGPFISSSLPYPLGIELRSGYQSVFKHIVRYSWTQDYILTAGEKKLSKTGNYIDPDGPEMLSLKMLKGSLSGLKDPHSIMLSASSARALFTEADPIGRVVTINNKTIVKVTGVYEDLPLNTEFHHIQFFSPWDLWVSENDWIMERAVSNWMNHFVRIYCELKPGVSFQTADQVIADAEIKHIKNLENYREQIARNPKVFIHPMKDWHLRPVDRKNIIDPKPMRMVSIVAVTGLFVLLLACINFMNLSTARSEKRAKEVGIRKTIGSRRGQLIMQFFAESFFVVILSFLLASLLAAVSLPQFNGLTGKSIIVPWSNIYFWLSCTGFIVITGLLAGSYPAFYLSSFRPIKVLKGTFRVGRLAAVPRKALVVMQFTFSVALIICTIVVYRQLQHAKNRPVGYDREGLIMVDMRSDDFEGKYQLFRSEFFKTGVVAGVSESRGMATEVVSGNNGFDWQGKNPNINESFGTLPVTHEHGKTVGWQFVKGRDFSANIISDSSGVVINEAAARFMNLTNPIGEIITWKWNDNKPKPYTILGVIKDAVMESPYQPVEPAMFFVKSLNGGVSCLNIRVKPDVPISQALPKIEAAFKQVVPAVPFEYKFADEEYALKFAAEEYVANLATFSGMLAIFISCLGLFGLASFVAEQRTKEIGVRKVLGASVFNLWRLLSKEFLALVIIAFLIAAPVAYYFMFHWLQDYQYRVELSWWIFMAAGSGALMITLLTVSFQAIKAALANPVKSLRTE